MKLTLFKEVDFLSAVKALFTELKVPMNYVADEPTTAKEILKDTYKDNTIFNLIDDVYFVGMVDDAAFEGNESLSADKIKSDYDGILIFGIILHQRENYLLPSRSQLAEISRAFNREFYYTPVVLVFKYSDDTNQYIAFANTERLKYKQEWREGEKVGKVSLLRDINIEKPHRGHEDIINQLKIPTSGKNQIDSFAKLYNYWQEVFSVNILNKKFYQELSNWYFWAIKQVRFPNEPTQEIALQKNAKLDDLIQEHNATNVIRLLTRLLFTWFIKEKKLIPDELFDLNALQQDILKEISPYHEENSLFKDANKESVYYKAILQNLFFATLNCPIKADDDDNRTRAFRGLESYGKHRGIDWMMRYKKHFKNPDAFLEMVNKVVPFLNGGLFECLDDKTQNLYIDGFSDQMTKGEQLVVPDYLFFGTSEQVDLSADYGVKNKQAKQAAVKGLINILKSYKFTITENTPIEEDVALDPELLGKVFENLLASYNPETKTTARKQTGSFYTPREIVNYMVDESLIAYLKNAVSFQLTDITKQDALCTFFSPNNEVQIHQGNLPHWEQKDVWYFVTFRLADSIPFEKQEQLKFERGQWLKKHKKDEKYKYTKEQLKEYYKLFSERVEGWLNNGYGSCVLKDEKNAKIVEDALKHFEGERYKLDEWVVMPNHVHVLVKPLANNKISDILHSWKSFTANEINKNIGKSGQLWMHESYDHIVRNEKAFEAIKNYIRQNPEKAGILAKASSRVPEASSFGETQSKDALDTMLHQLTSFDNINPFTDYPETSKQIVYALDRAKILDPAAGSGAFPMGILQKMVHILQKLDPGNELWKEVQLEKALAETKDAYDIDDKEEREQKLIEINNAFDEQINDPDFARKLYLIENCIYGVDIQPIATQISKLRFFISLVVDQKVRQEEPNFGIRPLPNLETKFVTANTLIGLEKPDIQRSLFDSPKIEELEKELKQIRHKLFNAKTKATKLKYRKRDEELRNEIAEELQNHGWSNASAKQLASWDPYDQNASSPFFDPEWMFDIKEGFDIVIGNPPYVVGKFNKTEISYFKTNYKSALYQINLYMLFTERSHRLSVNDNGIVSLIVPNTWLINKLVKPFRSMMLRNYQLYKIVDCTKEYVFDATVLPVIFISQNRSSSKTLIEVFNYEKNSFNYRSTLTQASISESNNLLINYQIQDNEIPITEHIIDGTVPLSEIANSSFGVKFYQKGKGVPKQSAEIVKNHSFTHSSKINNNCKLILEGKNIERFQTIEPTNYIEYGNWLAEPRSPEMFKGVRIVLRRIVGDEGLIANIIQGDYCNNSLLHVVKIKSNSISNNYLLGLLNSRLLGWFFIKYYARDEKTFPEIRIHELNSLPIKINQNYFFALQIMVSVLKNSHSNQYFSIIDKILDSLIFNLYFPDHMKERGIDVLEFVERDIAQVLQGRAFEDLSDSEKEEVIEQLHTIWTDPDNEVVKRMAMFKEKSPDILKVILES